MHSIVRCTMSPRHQRFTLGTPWATVTLRRFHLTILRVCRHVMPPRLIRDVYESYIHVLRNLSSYYTNTKTRLSTSSLILFPHSPCTAMRVDLGYMGECEDQGYRVFVRVVRVFDGSISVNQGVGHKGKKKYKMGSSCRDLGLCDLPLPCAYVLCTRRCLCPRRQSQWRRLFSVCLRSMTM